MTRIDETFSRLKQKNERAFMPFITAGDPNLAFTERLISSLDEAGVDLIELGIPYSDPIADGLVIQESYSRALRNGVKLDAIFEMLQRVKPRIKAPLVTMVSYAIIFRTGVDKYLQRARDAGVSGLIVPDLPSDESDSLGEKCRAAGLDLIQLITPTTSVERAQKIAQRSRGFIYYVSVTGITGERTEMPADVTNSISRLKERTGLPICVGFGISKPEHIERLKSVADGFIVGSAFVKRIGEASQGVAEDSVLDEVKRFTREMMEAAKAKTINGD